MNTFAKSITAVGCFMLVAMQSFAVTAPAKSPLRVEMYPVADTYKMNVVIEKDQSQPLTVILKDKDQQLVHKHTIAQKSAVLSQKIDFANLEDGVYYLTITDGISEVVKEIKFHSKDFSDMSYLTLMGLK